MICVEISIYLLIVPLLIYCVTFIHSLFVLQLLIYIDIIILIVNSTYLLTLQGGEPRMLI